MTERAARHVRRSASSLQIGPSACFWRDGELLIEFNERASPLPRRVRGTLRVRTPSTCSFVATLDPQGRHRWGPIAPCARIEVELQSPALRWSGHAYVDSNEGDEPITEPFSTWDWMRAPLPDGSCAVAYDIRLRDGAPGPLIGRRFWPDGCHEPLALPPRQALRKTGWGIARHLRAELGAEGGEDGADGHLIGTPAHLLQTLEDTPFYARSIVRSRLCGESVLAMHETLDARRFAAPWVQALLPFRMPRQR